MATSTHTTVRRAELAGRRWGERPHRAVGARSSEGLLPAVALRLAHDDDDHLVRRLAALDDAPTPEGPVLLALVNGDAVAAMSLLDGRVVANPFVPTTDAVALLRLRADHLAGPEPRRSRGILLRRSR